MILVLVRLEWRLARREPVVWMLAVLGVMLITGAGWLTHASVRDQERAAALARDDEARRLAGWEARALEEQARLRAEGKPLDPVTYGVRHPTFVGHYSGKRYAILPSAPLASLAVGDTDLLPSRYLVSVDRRQFVGLSELQHPLWLRSGRYDPAFVLTVVFPLLLIGAVVPILSRERESGALGLLAAQGAPLPVIALIRAASRGGVVIVALTAAVAGVVLCFAPQQATAEAASAARLMLATFATVVYGAFWLMLAVVVDAASTAPRVALTRLAGAWLLLVVLLPAAIQTSVAVLRPMSSRADFEATITAEKQRIWNGDDVPIMAAFYREHPHIAPTRDPAGSNERFMIYQMRAVLLLDERVRDVEERYARQRQAQHQFLAAARFVSPALLMQHALEELAGTGAGRRAHFDAQLDTFFRRWRAFLIPRIYNRTAVVEHTATPRFFYVDEQMSQVMARCVPDMLAIGAATLLLGLSALRIPRLR